MVRTVSQIWCLPVLLLVAACGPGRVDGTSEESLKESLEKVKAGLPENDREKLDQAIQEIAFEDLGLDDLLVAGMIKLAPRFQNLHMT